MYKTMNQNLKVRHTNRSRIFSSALALGAWFAFGGGLSFSYNSVAIASEVGCPVDMMREIELHKKRKDTLCESENHVGSFWDKMKVRINSRMASCYSVAPNLETDSKTTKRLGDIEAELNQVCRRYQKAINELQGACYKYIAKNPPTTAAKKGTSGASVYVEGGGASQKTILAEISSLIRKIIYLYTASGDRATSYGVISNRITGINFSLIQTTASKAVLTAQMDPQWKRWPKEKWDNFTSCKALTSEIGTAKNAVERHLFQPFDGLHRYLVKASGG